MLLLVCGFVFYYLFNSNLKIYESLSFINFLRSPKFAIIFFGLRYSPRILFSCSGFSFIYKYLSYLDSRSGPDTSSSKDVNISNIYFFKFLFRQFYKYLMHLLLVLFFRYSIFYIFAFLSDSGPMSVFFKLNVIDRMKSKHVLGNVFLYASYEFYYQSPLNIFWMGLNEISFFLISSLIVFISYKKNLRKDIFFLFAFFILIIARLTVYFLWDDLYATLFYYFEDYGYLFINPLYNYPFYILGIFFGQINYTIQNSITRKDAIGLKKNYFN